ncbi:MAG TPA: carbon-nitrogen hydrolase family protein [Propionicimonas sp.]
MRVALVQLTSGHDVEANLAKIVATARAAAAQGAELLVYPEATMFAFGASLTAIAQPIDGPFGTAVHSLAAELGVTIVVGMFTPAGDGRVYNTLLVARPEGASRYDKIHLFDAFGFQESRTVAPGRDLRRIGLGDATIGLATCYDVRFPSLFVENAAAGAQVSIVSASWGAGPGKVEQWELLVRARAIDTTGFVIACDQADPAARGVVAGSAPTGVGHSMVVSPYGEVLGSLGAGEDTLVVDLDLATVTEAREAIPVLRNRRPFA